jgi:hypothetical protein
MTKNTVRKLLEIVRDGKLDNLIEAVAKEIFRRETLPGLLRDGLVPKEGVFFPIHKCRAEEAVKGTVLELLVPSVLASKED